MYVTVLYFMKVVLRVISYLNMYFYIPNSTLNYIFTLGLHKDLSFVCIITNLRVFTATFRNR